MEFICKSILLKEPPNLRIIHPSPVVHPFKPATITKLSVLNFISIVASFILQLPCRLTAYPCHGEPKRPPDRPGRGNNAFAQCLIYCFYLCGRIPLSLHLPNALFIVFICLGEFRYRSICPMPCLLFLFVWANSAVAPFLPSKNCARERG